MADLAQLDLRAKGGEARLRALLEDVVESHMGIRPGYRLALAVWFRKTLENQDQHLLELFTGVPMEGINDERISLLWKTGSNIPPFVNIRFTSVDYFTKLLGAYPDQVNPYRDKYEILYFDKNLLNPPIIEGFNILTEPSGLIKGWYIGENEAQGKSIQTLISTQSHIRPYIGLVKTQESADFENCRGLLHVEVSQKWRPLSPEGIRSYDYYRDQQNGSPGYFLFEGGALYRVLKFEIRTVPEYASGLLSKTSDDRYPEVYLRAVHPPTRTAA